MLNKALLSLWFILSFTVFTNVYAKTFVYCSDGSPSAFNPQVVSDGPSINASSHPLYSRLVDFEYGTTNVIPSLAEKWEISKDKKTYTFTLRKGVKFHKTKYFEPTRDFNAEDVVFSFRRMMDKANSFHKVGGGNYEYFKGMGMDKLIANISKVDEYTLKIQLNKPESPFLSNLAMPFMSVLSKEYAQSLEKQNKKDDIDVYPVGTGPFIFKKYIKDNLIRYKANDDYFLGRPKIDKMVFAITPDPSVRYQKLKTGECHLIIEPAPADLEAMKKNPQIKLIDRAGMNVGYLAMNTKKKPLNNKLVRKAIYLAMNKPAYIKAIYLGNAMEAVNPLPPSIWSYDKSAKPMQQNIAQAKKLLAKAGYAKGFDLTLWTLPITRPYNPNGKKMGEMMKADLEKIGIKAKLIQYDWSTYLKKSNNGEHDLLQIGWTGDNGDPDNFLHTLLGCSAVNGGSNYAKWCNKKFNKLITDAKRHSDIKTRSSLYLKAQKIFQDELPWVPIAHAKVFRAMAPNVTGYKISPLGGDIFTWVDLK